MTISVAAGVSGDGKQSIEITISFLIVEYEDILGLFSPSNVT
jgi:hypothetical protein